MSKIVGIDIEFNDDFEPGDCYDCPLAYTQYGYTEDNGYDSWNSCVMNTRYDECYLRDTFGIK